MTTEQTTDEPRELFPIQTTHELSTYAVTRVASDADVQKHGRKAAALLEQVDRVTVTSMETYTAAGDLLKLLKGARNYLDARRKHYVANPTRAIKAVNGFFKTQYFDPIDAAERSIKGLMGPWYAEHERKRQEEARRAALEAERQALEAAAALEEQGQQAAADAIVDQGIKTAEAEEKAAERTPVHGDHGSTTSARRQWKWRLVDLEQVPREFLTVDKVLVQEAIKTGAREIPGLEIYEDVQIAIR